MDANTKTPVLIIGSGPAGYTAGIYAARANLKPVLVSGLQPGGQLSITTDVENYPGFADPIQGPWLMDQMRAQAEHCDVTVVDDIVSSLDLSERPFAATLDSGKSIAADTVILATGAQAKWLGLENETKFSGFGVSACATCDGFFYRGKDVIVVGGGNTAVEEALYLSKLCKQVTLVHRRDSLRAEHILQQRLFAKDNVHIEWDTELVDVKGDEDPLGVTGATLKSTKSGETRDVAIDGIFIAIGHSPASELVKGQIEMDDTGYIITKNDSTATNIEGVYACGDVQDHIYRQAVTAAGTGCMAALEAERWLAGGE